MGRRFASALIFLIVIAGSALVYADDNVRLMVGRSTVVNVGTPITRVSLTSPDIADALVTSPSELLINGKTPGTISMFVWDRQGAIRKYEIVVQRDLARLQEQMKQLFPADGIEVQSNGRNIVLTGTVTNKDVIERAVNLASGYVDKKEEVVTLLKMQEGAPTNQVLLRVRFAEVSRSALTELGVGFFTSPTGAAQWLGRTTTGQFPAPTWTDQKWAKSSLDFGSDISSAEGKFAISDFLNLFLFSAKYDLGAAIRALQQRGLFESLAEPNLVAESGKEASFLAGGEFPIPVAQGGVGNVAVTVTFKEFGVRLNFTPTVIGNRVHLKVKPEVSSLDFANAVSLNGFRIPALTTRRTETELELGNGQTFAIAGLLNNNMTQTMQKIPGIGDIPILGLLFKSKAAQKNRTELVVMITPEILANNSGGVTRELPRLQEPLMPTIEQKKSQEMPPAHFTSGGRGSASAVDIVPATPQMARPAVQPVAVAAPQANDPASAAAKVQALTPQAPTMRVEQAVPAAVVPATVVPTASTPAVKPATTDNKATPQSHSREEAAKAVDGKVRAKQIEEDRKRQEKAAQEQAKHDAEAQKVAAAAAKRQAEIDRAANETAAKRAAEQAKKQAEIDKKNSKSVSDAEARLKAAQAAYEAEMAKTKKQQQQ
jgi:pilus assembly protein CpaC